MKVRFSGLVAVCLGGLLSVAVAGDPQGAMLCYTVEFGNASTDIRCTVAVEGLAARIEQRGNIAIALVNPPIRPGDPGRNCRRAAAFVRRVESYELCYEKNLAVGGAVNRDGGDRQGAEQPLVGRWHA